MTSVTTASNTVLREGEIGKRSGWLPKNWHVHVFLITACLVLGFPLYYAMLVSTQTNAQVFNQQFTPGASLLENIELVMVTRDLTSYMINTVVVAVIVTIGKTILSLLAGLAFVYFRFPGKWLIFGFVLITLMMPTEILILALYQLVTDLGWGNTIQALTVPFLASATGTFLFRQHFMNIPAELSEAAQLDGATPLQFLFQVLVPMSWNTVGALAVIQFVYVWNMYIWPVLIVQNPDIQMVQVGLRTLIGGDTITEFGPLMLGAVISSLPPVLVFVLLQKHFMSGFALSRDK
jgi:sn-glycerol 3-phosphate transport system permease protein